MKKKSGRAVQVNCVQLENLKKGLTLPTFRCILKRRNMQNRMTINLLNQAKPHSTENENSFHLKLICIDIALLASFVCTPIRLKN